MDVLLDFKIMVFTQFLRLRDLKKKSFVYKGCLLWNDLPLYIRKINGLREFKDALNNYLLLQWIVNVIYWLSDIGFILFVLILVTQNFIYFNHFINFYKFFRTLTIYQIGICDMCMFEMYTLIDIVITMPIVSSSVKGPQWKSGIIFSISCVVLGFDMHNIVHNRHMYVCFYLCIMLCWQCVHIIL